MPNYQKGKIYKLFFSNDPSFCYVGSTAEPLKKRLSGHLGRSIDTSGRYDSKLYRTICEMGDGWEIQLIENYPCQSLEELRIREQYFIDILKPTLNERGAYQSETGKKELQKQWYKRNRESILQSKQQKYFCEPCKKDCLKHSKTTHERTALHIHNQKVIL